MSASTSPDIRAASSAIDPSAEFGPDVVIEADELIVGPGSRIGFSGADDFRTPAGVRIAARRVVLGPNVRIGRAVRIEGGEIRLDESVQVFRHSTVNVRELLHLGAFGTVNERCEISGRHVTIGQELWMLPGSKIGGGSAFETPSRLEAGHYLHLGVDTLVNTARPVTIGHEVGLGTRTAIYTHGAYPSALRGFPVAFEGVSIGDFTWIPGAVINPGVRIGRNCVVGVNSLVTRDIPDGSLAAGSPAKVIREQAYPRLLGSEARRAFFELFLGRWSVLLGGDGADPRATDDGIVLDVGSTRYAALVSDDAAAATRVGSDASRVILVGSWPAAVPVPDAWTVLDPATRRIAGRGDPESDRLVNELRRYGIRFYSRRRDARYVDWEPDPPVTGSLTAPSSD